MNIHKPSNSPTGFFFQLNEILEAPPPVLILGYLKKYDRFLLDEIWNTYINIYIYINIFLYIYIYIYIHNKTIILDDMTYRFFLWDISNFTCSIEESRGGNGHGPDLWAADAR